MMRIGETLGLGAATETGLWLTVEPITQGSETMKDILKRLEIPGYVVSDWPFSHF